MSATVEDLYGYYNNTQRPGVSPSYPVRTPGSFVNPSGGYGVGIPNPNDPSGWYATNKGGGPIREVTGEEYRRLNDSSHSNRDLIDAAARTAAMIYGGAALSGMGAGGAASGIGNAGLGFGGQAAGAAGATGFGSGTASITDAAYGALPEAGSIGAEGVGAAAGGASLPGWGPAVGTIGGGPPVSGGWLSSLLGGVLGGGGGTNSIWPAVISGGASLLGGAMANRQIGNASDTAAQLQRDALGQQAEMSAPYRELGSSAIPQLKDLLGIGTHDPTAALRATPGYNFARDEGLNATKNQASAMGMSLSGNTLEALDRYGTGLADQTYQSAVGNAQNAAGLGQAAAAGQAANIGNAGANLSNIATNRGNALAGIDVNTLAGITRAIGNYADNNTLNTTLKNLGGP